MASDLILIQDLLVRGIIGVHEDERHNRQDILINVALEVDTRPAAQSDRVEDTVSYSSVAKQIVQLVESSQFFLVETLASAIARLCLTEARVQGVRVRVEKPRAVRFARSVGVEIYRTRHDF